MSPDTAPLVRTIQAELAAVAAGADGSITVAEAPFASTVTGVTWTPPANVTGDNTESRHLALVNKGLDGNGATVVATLDFDTGVNAADFDEKAFVLSVVPGATTVVEGAILAVTSTHEGATGLADPGGLIEVEFTRA